jgi:hypothetical protein
VRTRYRLGLAVDFRFVATVFLAAARFVAAPLTGNPPLCPKARFVRHFVAEKSGHVVSAREDQPFLATFGRLSPPQKFRSQP